MTEFTNDAQRLLRRRKSRLERKLRKAGVHIDEIEAVTAGLEEYVSESHSGEELVGTKEIEASIEEFTHSLAENSNTTDSADGLGKLALGVSLITVGGMVLAGSFSESLGIDGGAIMSTIGLFGVATTLILGLFSRRSKFGRASIWIVASVSAMFAIAIIVAMLDP